RRSLAVGIWVLAAIASVEAPCRMSTVGQSVSTDGSDSAAIAERSAGVVCTVENPGTDGNQADAPPPEPPPERDEQPTRPRASPAAMPTAANRLTEYARAIDSTAMWSRCPQVGFMQRNHGSPKAFLGLGQGSSLRRA